MSVDPVGERLRPARVREGEARGAEHGDEDLRHADLPGEPVNDHRDPVASVIDEQPLAHGGGDRLRYRPSWARLVSSAWDGRLNSNADVNFLEHHVEKHSAATGRGNICPVTKNPSLTPTCDLAKCEKCFRIFG